MFIYSIVVEDYESPTKYYLYGEKIDNWTKLCNKIFVEVLTEKYNNLPNADYKGSLRVNAIIEDVVDRLGNYGYFQIEINETAQYPDDLNNILDNEESILSGKIDNNGMREYIKTELIINSNLSEKIIIHNDECIINLFQHFLLHEDEENSDSTGDNDE